VAGSVGADDYAAAIAVQLESARALRDLANNPGSKISVKFVSFALEEPPTFATRTMGSKVYAGQARRENEKIEGMLCLEMVGYFCDEPGCQSYPFPLMFMNYPREGNFIGIVGNSGSRGLTRALQRAFGQNPELPVVTLTVPLNGWLLPSVRLSDHSAFWDEGFKAVMITDSAFFRNPHYHLPSDTMDKLDFRRMAELVKSLIIFFTSADQ
jgi:Zn-dependent M28 family amino/carboxypeptidase